MLSSDPEDLDFEADEEAAADDSGVTSSGDPAAGASSGTFPSDEVMEDDPSVPNPDAWMDDVRHDARAQGRAEGRAEYEPIFAAQGAAIAAQASEIQELRQLVSALQGARTEEGAIQATPPVNPRRWETVKRGRSAERPISSRANGAGPSSAAGNNNGRVARNGMAKVSRTGNQVTASQRNGCGSPNNMRVYKNKNGREFRRSAHLISHLVANRPHRCWCCYQEGHVTKDCTNSPVSGYPADYKPPQ